MAAITIAKGIGVSSANLANIPMKKMLLHLTTLSQHLHCIPGNSEYKGWQMGENSGKSTSIVIKIQIFQVAELYLIIPNNTPSVWALKSEPRSE